MVKADPSRNYYADLKVPATATESEIRKAFRTLALQYHPDRNPGHEAEVVVKFQEIQAAHEVLTDQTQRAQYDAARKRYRGLNTPNIPRTRPPPPTRNTYTTSTPSGTYNRAPPPRPSAQRPPPPQHNASYSGADRFSGFRPPPTAQKPPEPAPQDNYARANAFTAWQKMKSPRESRASYEARMKNAGAQSKSTDESAHNGQTNPNGTPFGRSQSTRAPSSRKGFDPGMPGADEGQAKSAYRNYTRPAPTPPNSTTPPHQRMPSAKASPAEEVPYSEGNRIRTPYYSSAAGERTSMFEGLGRSASVRNSPTNPFRPHSGMDPGSYSDSGHRQQRNSYGGRSTNPFRHMYPDSSDSDSEREAFSNADKHRDPSGAHAPPPPPPPPAQNTQKPPPPTSWNSSGSGTSQIPRRTSNGAAGNTPSNFKSRSEESINIKFSPSDWHGTFQSGTDYFAPDMQRGGTARGRTSPTRGRQTQRSTTDRNPFAPRPTGPPPVSPFTHPNTQYPSFPIPPPPPGPPPNLRYPPRNDANTQKAEFKAEDWAKTFKEPTWVFSEQKETSPRRGAEGTKRPPKANRKGSVAQEKRSKAQEQAEAKTEKRHQATVDDDDDAMDIDTNTPPVTNGTTPKRGSRTAPSSPHRSSFATPNGTGATTNGVNPPASALHGLGKMARDDLFTSAKDSQDGGIALDELGQTLPYESQASNGHPTKPNTAQKLKFPNLPRPPSLPPKLDHLYVDTYFSQFAAYVKEYRKVRKQITAHFVARDAELDNDLDQRFVHHRGETSKKMGFASYMSKMREDEVVAETLKYFQEQHLLAVAQCEELRNKTIKMYSNPLG